MKRWMQILLVMLVIGAITGIGLAAKPTQPVDPLSAVWAAIAGLQANDTAQDASIAGLQENATAQEEHINTLQINDTTQEASLNALKSNATTQQMAITYLFAHSIQRFGSWNSAWITGYPYAATTDGFLVINVDSPNPSANERLCAYTYTTLWDPKPKMCISLGTYGGMTIPIKAGDGWEVDQEPGFTYVPVTIQWLPLIS